MSARSQMNATCLPSGDQTGSDGCLVSMSCSIVSVDLAAGLRLAVCARKWLAQTSAVAMVMAAPKTRFLMHLVMHIVPILLPGARLIRFPVPAERVFFVTEF